MSERYLPGPPAPNRGGLVTILLVVGIALLASISLTLFGVAFEVLTMTMVAGIAGFAAFGVFMLWFLWSANRFYTETDGALAALEKGDFEKAAQVWAGWEARRAPVMVRAQAAHNLGWTAIRQGEPRRALEILGANDHRRREGLASAHLAATTAQDLALCYALIGDTEAAEAWFDESERRVTGKAPSTYGAMKAFVRAVIDVRAGRNKDAVRGLQDTWAELENTPGALLRPLRVVRAFAGNTGGLGSIPPAYPGEYSWLGVEWPEMAAFLKKQNLA